MTLEMRNRMRQQLLAVDAAALKRVAERYLQNSDSAISVLAGEGALNDANEQLGAQALTVRKI